MKKLCWRIVAVVFWLLLWQTAAMAVNQRILLVSPLETLQALFSLLQTAAFYQSVAGSLLRILAGFFAGLVLGVGLAALAKIYMPLREMLFPVMSAVKATPVASFVILALIWIPSKNLSIFMAFLMVLPLIYSNFLEGLNRADAQLLEMAKVFRMSAFNRIRGIYWPAAFPYLLTAMRLSLGMCWKAGIAAEVIAQPKNSIGSALHRAKVFFSTPELFAWTLAIILLSVTLEKCMLHLVNRLGRGLENAR